MMIDSRPDWTTQRVPSQPEVYTENFIKKKKKDLSGSFYFFVVYGKIRTAKSVVHFNL